jgi:SAM-dependent methyltransferase
VDSEAFRALLSPAGAGVLREAVHLGIGEDDLLVTSARLRDRHPPELVAAALTQARLRARAVAKFGRDAARMYFTPDGLEQATRPAVAALRAGRYAALGRPVTDLCCGIGGDLVALAGAGLPVTGVDADPLTVEVATANLAALGLAGEVVRADVTAYDVGGAGGAVFCDPARRAGGRRVFDPASYSPPWDFLLALREKAADTGFKVAPGLPHDLIPADAEAEWVSDRGDVKEAALWFGDLRSEARRRATVLPAGATLTGGDASPPPAGPVRRYLYDPDGAVVRAHLVAELAGQLDATLLDPTIAYLTADRPAPTPFARSYEVTEVLPFQLKRLRALLRERRIGILEIKKRGSALEPETLRRDLKLSGPESATLVLTRVAGRPTAILCDPVGG